MSGIRFEANGERPPPGTTLTFDAHTGELLRVTTPKSERPEVLFRWLLLAMAVGAAFALKMAPSLTWVWVTAFFVGRIMDSPPETTGWRFAVATGLAIVMGMSAFACVPEPLGNPA